MHESLAHLFHEKNDRLGRKDIFSAISLFFALSSYTAPAKILYYDFFGEFLNEKPYLVNLDFEQESIKTIKDRLEIERKKDPGCTCSICKTTNKGVVSDLVIIGYGEDLPENFFAATTKIDLETPLAQTLKEMPTEEEGRVWQIYFISRELSHYVTKKENVHWACPFKALTKIGQQNLRFFP